MSLDSSTLLLLEPDEAVQEMFRTTVLRHDLAMQAAFSMEDAHRQLAQGQALAFAFNIEQIKSNPVETVRQLLRDHPNLPLLALVSNSNQDLVLGLLQAGIFACLTFPFQAGDLAYNLKKILANSTDTYNPFAMKYEERTLIMPNDFSLVMQVSKSLVDGALPLHQKHRYHIILGLAEVINNAVEHGNLGISFEEKSAALKASCFFPLAIERSQNDPYKDRVVTIRSRIFPNLQRIEYFVGDEGNGFDWRSLPDPKNKENILNRNGRGIMMARYAFDEMTFNEVGNEVTMVVNLEIANRRLKH